MRKWQFERKQEQHFRRIVNAKSTMTKKRQTRLQSVSRPRPLVQKNVYFDKLLQIFDLKHCSAKLAEIDILNRANLYRQATLNSIRPLVLKLKLGPLDSYRLLQLIRHISKSPSSPSKIIKAPQIERKRPPLPKSIKVFSPAEKLKRHTNSRVQLSTHQTSHHSHSRKVQPSNDDISVVHIVRQGQTHLRLHQKLCQRLPLKQDNNQLRYQQYKQLYLSYEGGRLGSSLVDLDLEEVSFCLARVVMALLKGEAYNRNLFQYFSQREKLVKKWRKAKIIQRPQSSQPIPSSEQNSSSQEGKQLVLSQLRLKLCEKKQQINQLIKRSLKLVQKQMEQIQMPQECLQGVELTQSRVVSSLSSQESGQQSLDRLFQCRQSQKQVYLDCQSLKIFIINFVNTLKTQIQVCIMATVFLQRLIKYTDLALNLLNCKAILFTALLLAAKMIDDQCPQNQNICEYYTDYSATELNKLQRVFLQKINYNSRVRQTQYCKVYFLLRSYSDKSHRKCKSKPQEIYSLFHRFRNQPSVFKLKKNKNDRSI